jgi:hypothetical protein
MLTCALQALCFRSTYSSDGLLYPRSFIFQWNMSERFSLPNLNRRFFRLRGSDDTAEFCLRVVCGELKWEIPHRGD